MHIYLGVSPLLRKAWHPKRKDPIKKPFDKQCLRAPGRKHVPGRGTNTFVCRQKGGASLLHGALKDTVFEISHATDSGSTNPSKKFNVRVADHWRDRRRLQIRNANDEKNVGQVLLILPFESLLYFVGRKRKAVGHFKADHLPAPAEKRSEKFDVDSIKRAAAPVVNAVIGARSTFTNIAQSEFVGLHPLTVD